jgi:hypothetical protein
MDIVFKHYAPFDYIIWGDDGASALGLFSNDMFAQFIFLHQGLLGLGPR